MTIRDSIFESALEQTVTIRGAHYARGPRETALASIQIKGGRIAYIQAHSPSGHANPPASIEIDLSGFLVMPGLINAHDHLEFSLFPRLAIPPTAITSNGEMTYTTNFPMSLQDAGQCPKMYAHGGVVFAIFSAVLPRLANTALFCRRFKGQIFQFAWCSNTDGRTHPLSGVTFAPRALPHLRDGPSLCMHVKEQMNWREKNFGHWIV